MIKRLLVVFLLGFASGLPLALLTGTLQAWFADAGCSMMVVGLLSLIGLPYTYCFLWAPLLDHYSLSGLGRRRSWMLSTQLILLVGFNAMAWMSPHTYPMALAVMATCLAFFSATQDVAVNAQRTEYLPAAEQALGASLAILGYRIALLLGGGGSLILAYYCDWVVAYRLMGLLMMVGIAATLWSPEPTLELGDAWKRVSLAEAFWLPAKAFFARPRFGWLLLFIVFYKLGEAFTASTSGTVMPFLIQGLGFPLHVIGYVNKVAGISAAIAGGLLAGCLLMRWTLFRGLLVFGLLQVMSCLLFVVLAFVGNHLVLLCVAVVCENVAAGMSSVALVTLFMRLVDTRFTATQFAMLMAFSTLPRLVSGPIAAVMVANIGWIGLYGVVSGLACLFVPLLCVIAAPKSHSVPSMAWPNIQMILGSRLNKEY